MERQEFLTMDPVCAIANRGEIAIRVARTVRARGLQPVVLLGDPDLESFAARAVGRVERVGPAGSELNPAAVVAAAERAGATMLHPGYGFLSERPELSALCQERGITFIGPSPETLALCGDKIATRQVAVESGVPVLPASDPLDIADESGWAAAASAIGFPVIAKIAGGGGGRGMRVAASMDDLSSAVRSAIREAGASAAGERLYLERYLSGARHVEVQVAASQSGAVALGDRDCSIQRRHQKVIEEAPAPRLSTETRSALHRHAVALAEAVSLRGVATVEFLLGRDGEIAFLEINPRLQVEHTVTEEVTGLDLVDAQLSIAFGKPAPEPTETTGHSIQARLYAEDPLNGFAPNPGLLRALEWPALPNLRVESGYQSGDVIPDAYDSMIAKIIVWGATREAAVARLQQALRQMKVAGVATNRAWLSHLIASETFQSATHGLSTAGNFTRPDDALQPSGLEAVAERLLPTERPASAWESLGPFRIVGNASIVLHGDERGGWSRRLDFVRNDNRWIARDSEAPHAASLDGTVVLETDDGYEVSTPDGRWIARVGTPPQESTGTGARDGAVRAPMPGAVVAVNAVPGQPVVAGDVLVVMTAMKIEMSLAAPFDGIVSAVNCVPGDLVGSRQVLATVVEPDERDEQDRSSEPE